jgi:hypothetical protein
MRTTLTRDDEAERWQVGPHELHAGDVFELELPGGTWLPVRFEFEWEHKKSGRPAGYCVLALAGGDAVLKPSMGARARLQERTESASEPVEFVEMADAVNLLVDFAELHSLAQTAQRDADGQLTEKTQMLLALLTNEPATPEDVEAVLPCDLAPTKR